MAHPILPVLAIVLITFSMPSGSTETLTEARPPGTDAPARVFWGDTHLHTSLSVDAYAFGNRAIGPQEAYRFAKGQPVKAYNGDTVRLGRPLDFLVIADHAENMGLLPELARGNRAALLPEQLKAWTARFSAAWKGVEGDPARAAGLWQGVSAASFTEGHALSMTARNAIWQHVARLADAENQPGTFTAFIGYEWTQWNEWLHRVVMYRDDAKRAERLLPFTAIDGSNPEELWAWMEAYETQTGGRVLAIPHNGNLTSGMMFALETADGDALSPEHARARQRWEPLLEITQAKGDSETHPRLSPEDTFADFERISMPGGADRGGDAAGTTRRPFDGWRARLAAETGTDRMRRFEYARSGLQLGLGEWARMGTNPFKFGMAGGTDMHTGLATTDEDNFRGASTSLSGPHPDRITGPWMPHVSVPGAKPTDPGQAGWTMSAAGLTAVWAGANTREALFDAMKRRETYATTGPRILVRFFGGWDYEAGDALRADLAAIGYREGVPMGADLKGRRNGESPRFLLHAARDPLGANLDRVQIIKGWQDASGELRERIYDVALSDGRRPDEHGVVPPVGNTVDLASASYRNTIGDPELAAVWRDPDFDPAEPAFYYARIIEIPTPKWTAFDAKAFGLKDLPPEVPMTTQERAYTSPIWYTPSEG